MKHKNHANILLYKAYKYNIVYMFSLYNSVRKECKYFSFHY